MTTSESERMILVSRRYRGTFITPSYSPHDDELDAVVETMTEKAKEGKAGELGYEVLVVEVKRRLHIQPQISTVDVTEEPT